jgi:hypothetical protein
MIQKRYQYWGFSNGKPSIMWTNWFTWTGDTKDRVQLKKLKNEYREL